ncbi:MAG TPA: cupredoxin family copper-binding protein [Nitrososphaeraceae archaeon]|jgi:plastocyanin|nr:cupredoxin family copper-binding protein [Nitrososphaeraceae archaeon]
MVKKNAVVIALVVIAGAIVVTYVLSGNKNMEIEGSGDSIQQPTASIPSNSTVVKIVANAGSNSFNPSPVEVKVGETVTWINDDSGRHTVTSNDGVFDSGVVGKEQSSSFTFDKAGEYPYFCEPHPNMVGTVVVTQS